MIDSNENEEKNIQNLNEIPPKDRLKTVKNHLKTIHRSLLGQNPSDSTPSYLKKCRKLASSKLLQRILTI